MTTSGDPASVGDWAGENPAGIHRVHTVMDEEDTGYWWACDCGQSGACGVGTPDDAEDHSNQHIREMGGTRIDV